MPCLFANSSIAGRAGSKGWAMSCQLTQWTPTPGAGKEDST